MVGVVEVRESNHHLNLGDLASDVFTYTYDFANNPLSALRNHVLPAGTTTVLEETTYDHSARTANTYHQVNGGPKIQVSQQAYTVKDELQTKYLGKVGASWLQTVDYAYLENGFLQSINDGTIGGTTMTPDLCSPALPNPGNTGENDLFQLTLNYDQVELGVSGTAQYNGNIAQLIWRVRGRERQTYGFDYDFLNRLDLANYYDITDGGTPRSSTNKYSVDIGYADDRGNIGSITRNGLYWDGSCWVEDEIDDLTFSYYPGTNRLKDVDDAATNATAAEEGFKPYSIGDSSADYFYDENGNLIFDPSKELSISYNYLNLPQRIEDADCKVLEFTYDAAGMKLRKTVKDGAVTITTQDYVGGIEYRGGVMEAIYHSEGRVYFEDGSSRYEYSLTDHLGNTRLMFSDRNGNGVVDMSDDPETTEVLQENHYYPFGMQMKGSWMENPGRESKYLFNGIERNEDLGLNWDLATFRSYDPAIGRWMQVDPRAEKYYGITPYNGMGNNPISIADPAGDTLRAVSETSAQRALGLIRSGLPSPLTANNLFSIGDDGVTFNSISGEALSNALVGLTADQAALVLGYAALINGSETNVVEVVNREETISEYGQEVFGGGMKTGADLDALSGGGRAGQARYDGNIVRLGADGTYGIVTANSQVRLDYNDGSRLGMPGETLAHELLGHGLGSRGGRSDGQQIDAAIQTGNIYLRTQGKTYYRPDHGVTNHTKAFNPNAIPNYLSRFKF